MLFQRFISTKKLPELVCLPLKHLLTKTGSILLIKVEKSDKNNNKSLQLFILINVQLTDFQFN